MPTTLPTTLTAAMALALVPSGVAQAGPLSLSRAITMALKRAPELRVARAGHREALAKASQARSAYLPRLSAQASYIAWWPKNELPIDLPDLPGLPEIGDIDDTHHVRAGLQAALRLLDFSRGLRLDAARSAAEAEKARVAEAEAALAFRVRVSFLSALLAHDMHHIAQESLKLARAEQKRASLQAEVGTGSQVALAQARVRVAQLSAQQRRAQSELQRHREQLASLVGLPLPQLPRLQGDLERLGAQPSAGDVSHNPTLTRLKAAAKASRLAAKSTARTLVPTLDLFGSAEVEYPHRMRLEWGPMLKGGLQLSWPFYEGGQRWARLREDRARSEKLTHAERSTREQLRRKLIDLQARHRTAVAELESARETLRQSQVYLRAARAARASGLGTDLEVHQAELGADRARIAVSKALFTLCLTHAEGLLLGGLVRPNRNGAQS